MNVNDARSSVERAGEYLRPRLPFAPRVGIVLGSGMGPYADKAPVKLVEAYRDIPGFPVCTIAGHLGRLVLTDRCGIPVALLQGRAHRYEGHTLEFITRPMRVLAGLGVETGIVTCAAGGLADLSVGEIMLVEDHLNVSGDNPLVSQAGAESAFGGFVEMAGAYDPGLLDLAQDVAQSESLPARRGVLACVLGPTYETRAEAAMLRTLGAHAVNMSTVPEVIVARSLGLRVLAFALITNQAGVPVSQSASHHQVVATGESKAEAIGRFLDRLLARLQTDAPGS